MEPVPIIAEKRKCQMSSKTDRELRAIKDLANSFRDWSEKQAGEPIGMREMIIHFRALLITEGYSPAETEQALAYMFKV